MNWGPGEISNFKGNCAIPTVFGIVIRLFKLGNEPFLSTNVDEASKGHVARKQLRCAISSCFDMGNICCKECSIKNCRYKCNFIDKEVCEHKYIE